MAKSGKVGRPRKYTAKQIEAINKKLSKYIDENDIPILEEFLYKNNLRREQLYEYAEFATLRKKLINKKKTNLEKAGLLNKVNTTMAIFSLKQLGWSDKYKVKHAGQIQIKQTIKNYSKEDILKEIEKLTK